MSFTVNDSTLFKKRLIVITPILKLNDSFLETAKSVVINLKEDDLWIISIDYASELTPDYLSGMLCGLFNPDQIKVLKEPLQPYAGNARNYALNYLNNEKFPFILSFLDDDDLMKSNYAYEIKKYFHNVQQGVVSFSYERHKGSKIIHVKHFDKNEQYNKFKYFYNTAPISTAVMINKSKDLNAARFGKRKRANDQKYFLDIIRYFGSLTYKSESIAIYNINHGSLSNNKLKMPVYKFFALRDHGLKITESLLILIYYAYYGFLRHYFHKERQ